MKRLIAGIDAGGTTFKLGVAGADGRLLAAMRVPTTLPAPTVAAAAAGLRRLAAQADGEIAALGLASFGPLGVDPQARDYGMILKTPKTGWSNAPLRAMLADALGVPVAVDTDVNAALLAEQTAGAARGAARAAYVTIGTGVGVGIRINGVFAGRPLHPELGHIRVERHAADASFRGACSVHGGCLEGLLSAPALIARYGVLENLPDDHEAWRVAGFYLAQLCLTLSLGWRLERIVLGGGVMNAPALLREGQLQFAALMGGYLPDAEIDPKRLIARAALGDDAGLTGALALARGDG